MLEDASAVWDKLGKEAAEAGTRVATVNNVDTGQGQHVSFLETCVFVFVFWLAFFAVPSRLKPTFCLS